VFSHLPPGIADFNLSFPRPPALCVHRCLHGALESRDLTRFRIDEQLLPVHTVASIEVRTRVTIEMLRPA
jgi:hypothetical protein